MVYLKNLSIQSKLLFGFGVVLALMLALSIYAGISAMRMNNKSEDITSNWMDGIEKIDQIDSAASDSRRKLMAMLLRTDAARVVEDQKNIVENHKTVDQVLQKYESEIDTTSYDSEAAKQEDKRRIGEIHTLWSAYEAQEDQIVQQFQAGQRAEAQAAINGPSSKAYNAFNDAIEQVKQLNNQGAQQAAGENRAIYTNVRWTSGILTVVALLLSSILAFFIIRDMKFSVAEILRVFDCSARGDFSEKIRVAGRDEFAQIGEHYNGILGEMQQLIRQIQQMAEQVATASEQLTSSAQQSAQATQQVAQSITEVAESAAQQRETMEEAVDTSRAVSDGTQHTVKVVGDTARQTERGVAKAKEGNTIVHATIDKMQRIAATVGDSAAVVARLGERSKEIGNIVDTISGIADQTNLLALNAAIEAARAGEHGKGFAVVAEEVRKLAEQSSTAAQQIAELIHNIQGETDKAVLAMQSGTTEVESGTQSVNGAGRAFEDILQVVNEVAGSSEAVTATMQELQRNITQIVELSSRVDAAAKKVAAEAETVSAATEEQSAGMQEIASGSRSLADMAGQMQAAAKRFKIE